MASINYPFPDPHDASQRDTYAPSDRGDYDILFSFHELGNGEVRTVHMELKPWHVDDQVGTAARPSPTESRSPGTASAPTPKP
ncbi:hypothetical protein ACFWGI_19015 [Streptomyces niveus]|uniref:hypothetical protein n=1 Tax=Streptomyces niveus TaxID=193462 RepID=UPI003666D271